MISVIVIDDDEDTVRLFSELLEENGISVIGKGFSGKDALSLFEEKKPDVSLIDIMMFEGSGFYAIKKIRAINPDAKIISITADLSSKTEEKLKKLSIPIVHKPFEIKKVLSLIKN